MRSPLIDTLHVSPPQNPNPPTNFSGLVDYPSSDDNDDPSSPKAPSQSSMPSASEVLKLVTSLSSRIEELLVSQPTIMTCLDLLHTGVLDLQQEYSSQHNSVISSIAKLQNDYETQASKIDSILKNQETILESLASLHTTMDKVPTSPPSIEVDMCDSFRKGDRFLLQLMSKKLNETLFRLSIVEGLLGSKGSTTEGEKTKGPALPHP